MPHAQLQDHALINESAEQAEHCHHSPMLKAASYTSYRLVHRAPSHFHPHPVNISRTVPIAGHKAQFHSSGTMEQKKVDEYKALGNRENRPPKHEMVHFKGLMSEKRAFGDFRTVLHTGLYSQVVAMEVPVGGEIGDEVGFQSLITAAEMVLTHSANAA